MANDWNPNPPYPYDEPGKVDTPSSRTRRQLIKGVIGTVIVAAAGYFSWTRFFFPPTAPRPWQGGIGEGTAGQAPIELGSVSQFQKAGKPTQVAVRGQAAFVDVVNGTPRILNAACTHRGCPVEWDAAKKDYLCPCHDSIFARDGSVVQGPATMPLAAIPSSVVGDTLYAQA